MSHQAAWLAVLREQILGVYICLKTSTCTSKYSAANVSIFCPASDRHVSEEHTSIEHYRIVTSRIESEGITAMIVYVPALMVITSGEAAPTLVDAFERLYELTADIMEENWEGGRIPDSRGGR